MNWIDEIWLKDFDEIARLTQNELNKLFWGDQEKIKITRKEDRSIVTEVDHFVSDLIKQKTTQRSDLDICYFSEEDKKSLYFPAVVVDPIDGTNQLARGESDCCISLALMQSPRLDDESNKAWIYNPFTGFQMYSGQPVVAARALEKGPLLGLISKSDYYKGIFDDVKTPSDTVLFPKGSIALKLAFLAGGFCDFVVSRTPKYIWDVAAGSLLLKERGYKTYTQKGELLSLDVEKLDGPLLWCREEYFEKLSVLLEF